MKKQLNSIEKKEYSYLIRVLSASVNKTKAPLPYEDINWNTLISLAKICGVISAFADVVLRLPNEYLPDDDTVKILRENINVGILIDSNLNFEIEKVLKKFDAYQIKNVPIKGYFLKKEYPRSDFRTVSDFDILFDVNQIEKVKKVFSELGYEFVHNDDNQYHFQKKPYAFIEMHTTLVHEWEHYYPYLLDSLNNSHKRDNYDYSYELSVDDHYLYMIVHNSNHFRMGALGIRMLLDTYIYYSNHKSDFDYDYLQKRLKLFKLDTFEKCIRDIAFNWFSPDKQLLAFDDLEVFILLGATFGRSSIVAMIGSHKLIKSAENQGKKKSKFSYFLASAFPKKSKMSANYPYLNKFPFLLPVSWFSMWFKRFFIFKNVKVKSGFKNRFSYTEEDINYFRGLLNKTGFDDFD